MSLRTLVSLSASEIRAFITATLLVGSIRVFLWLLPSRFILRGVRRLAILPERSVARRPSAAQIVWSIEAASRRIPRASCLTQAIATQILFRRHGYGSRLCLGVAPDAGSFRAHAWIERNGKIVIGGEESRALTPLTLVASTRESPTVEAL